LPIPERFIDELVERCDIVDIVGDYVRLTSKGGSLWGLCPFHNEKTSSFHVLPDRQMYKCFGCGKGGGVLNFIMEIEHLNYPDAIRFLAKRQGMEVPETADSGRSRRHYARCVEANTAAARFFHSCLKGPEGAAVRDYLVQRRISPRFAARFGLGAAPNTWDALITALTGQGFSKKELLEAGLCVDGKNGAIYDKFRARLMLPVISTRGEVIGFTSRILPGAEGAKYLNSSDTPCFKKSQIIYALNYAKNTKRPNFILVEGNLDVITLHQAGFDNVIATMGTSFTEGHAKILSGYRKPLVLCYDNDAAGKQSTERVLGILGKTNLSVRVLQLPNAYDAAGNPLKQDPDDFVKRYGPAAFEKCLDSSVAQNDYRLGVLLQGVNLEREEERMAFLKAAVETVGKLSSPVEREIYGRKAAEAANISWPSFAQEVERWRKGVSQQERRRELRRELAPATALQPSARALRYANIRSGRAEEGVIAFILSEPSFLERILLTSEEFSSPLYGRAFQLLRDRYREGLHVSLDALAGVFTTEEMNQLAAVAVRADSTSCNEQAMTDYIRIIRSEAAERRAHRDADALMAYRARQRETKAMEVDHEREEIEGY